MPSPGRINPPSALGLLAHAVDALERPNLTPVVASQSLLSNNARPANFEIELHGDDAPPRSITPGLDPDIAAMFGNEKAKTSKKRSRKRLSDDAKIDSAFVALEGLRAIRKLIVAGVTSLNDYPDPIINPPSVLGLLVHAVDALEQRNSTPVDAIQPPPSNNTQPDELKIFKLNFVRPPPPAAVALP